MRTNRAWPFFIHTPLPSPPPPPPRPRRTTQSPRACIHFLARIHWRMHTLTLSQWPLPARISDLGCFAKGAVWPTSPLWALLLTCLSDSPAMSAHVFVRYISWNARPVPLPNPIQGCMRKALTNILIRSWLESNLSRPGCRVMGVGCAHVI